MSGDHSGGFCGQGQGTDRQGPNQGEKDSIRVLLWAEHRFVLSAFQYFFEQTQEGKINFVGVASTGPAAIEVVHRTQAEIVLVLELAVTDSLRAGLGLLAAEAPGVRVLVCVPASHVGRLSPWLDLGIRGCLASQASAEELALAFTRVRSGEIYFSPSLADQIRSTQPAMGSALRETAAETLTGCEHQVLTLIAQGRSNKEMAVQLGVSVRTVEKHRESIRMKLRIHSSAGLTKFAIRAGLADLDSN